MASSSAGVIVPQLRLPQALHDVLGEEEHSSLGQEEHSSLLHMLSSPQLAAFAPS